VKKIAKLFLLFSLTFVILFLLSAGLGFLRIVIAAMSAVPARQTVYLADFLSAAEWALPFTLYADILLSMNYAHRNKLARAGSFLALFVMAFGFAAVTALSINHAGKLSAPPLVIRYDTPGRPGLVLTGQGVTVVLLDDPSVALGERVVSLQDRALLYQAEPTGIDGKPLPLPAPPFTIQHTALFDSLYLDFSLAGKELSARFAAGFAPYAVYSGAIIFILLSLAAVLNIGAWPLANIFLGAVLFRLVLAFDVFISGRDTAEYLAGFLGRWIPAHFVTPFILGAIGALLAVYSWLVSLAGSEERTRG
jgi:hypothetical protein